MVRRNPERREELLNAAIDVLARNGARGLTFRAVDEQAGVPQGTASNYFSGRDELLRQSGQFLFVRLTPPAEHIARIVAGDGGSTGQGRELVLALMRDILARAQQDRAGYLAMLELRLEATRRPDLRDAFTEHYRDNLERNITGHVELGLPGDRGTVVLLYLAMTGLVVEHLTLPGMLDAAGATLDELVADAVRVIVPDR